MHFFVDMYGLDENFENMGLSSSKRFLLYIKCFHVIYREVVFCEF